MSAECVSAVVVTYHPDEDVLENLRTLREQVESVVVVDNGSTVDEVSLLRGTASSLGYELIENGDNLGIATALNVGLRRVEAIGCEWVLMFDQDSSITDGFVRSMVRGFEEISAQKKLGILIPKYVDKRLGNPMKALRERDGRIETAMTSGSLVRMETLRKHGLFAEELFIDGVDHEHSLRMRSAGYAIEEWGGATLLHSPGSPTSHRFIRKKPFQSSNYSHVRRYYQERNKIWLVRRYWRQFPEFSWRQFRVSAIEFGKVVLFEQDKLRKIRYIFRGIWDGLRERMGRLDDN